MSFKIRTTAPDKNDTKYYGKENPYVAGGYGMPNCTTYTFGRFWELTGEKPKLPLTKGFDATTVFWHAKNDSDSAYKNQLGQTPKVGAIVCFSTAKNDNPGVKGSTGHVAIVERIESNGDIYCSNSAYKSTNFYMKTYSKASNYQFRDTSGRLYYLQGFIYPTETEEPKKMRMKGHIQDIGWGPWDEKRVGTTGQSKRLEAIMIDAPFEIEAKIHLQDIGWKNLGKITKDTIIGTVGESRRLECLCLKGKFEYRVHIQNVGWSAWTEADGISTLGTVGQALRIEMIEFRMI